MKFQKADILITICHQCDKTNVKDSIKHLDGEVFPSWSFITDYISEMPNYSPTVEYWEEPDKIFTESEIRDLCYEYESATLQELEHIYDGVEF